MRKLAAQTIRVTARTGRRLFVAGILLVTGCEKTAISVYHVPKADPWKLPAGWQEREAGGMRAARFSAPSTNGADLDVSIIPIRGFGGSQAEILNIWRQQLKLEPVASEAEAAQLAEKVTLGTVDAQLYDLTSTDPVLDGKAKARSLIAATRKDGTLWFVKMTGDDAGVGEQKPVFLTFLKGIKLNNIVAPPMPAMGRRGSSESPHGSGEGNDRGPNPEWSVPAGWTGQPPSQFLNAKFVVSGEDGGKVDVNVSVLEGDGGGLLENVNRWRGQVGLEPWDAASLEKNLTSFDAVETKAALVDFTGTDPRSGRPARLIGAIVPLGGRTWFYKMLGDVLIAEREKTALIKFVGTAKHPNG